jgi:hypothetical protein
VGERRTNDHLFVPIPDMNRVFPLLENFVEFFIRKEVDFEEISKIALGMVVHIC